jgi:tetratricopeptide (TPR) repeat protein
MTAAASSPASLPSRPKPIDNEFHRRGEELFDQGDYGAAAFMLGEAVRKDTGNAHLYVRLAVAQTMCAPPQLDGALANLDTALRISPNDGQAWLNRGNVLERQGDLEPAEEAFERAAASLQGDLKQVAQQRLAFARARQPETGAASSSSQPVRQDASSSPVHRTASAAGSVDSDPNSASSSSSATSADADAPSEALTGDIRVPEEAPPPYSPPISQSIPSIAAATQRRPIEVLTQALKLRSQGSVLVYRPEKRRVLDLVFVHCVGKAVLDSLFLDRPVLPPTHPAWSKSQINSRIAHWNLC